jgi:precorrin-3B synthase
MNAPYRRQACPGLTDPMPTGDGLLARLTPSGQTIGLDALASFCDAARAHGNGIIEVTSRGSIQVRGLTPTSAPDFAAAVIPLGIATFGPPVIPDPLGGLDPNASLDSAKRAGALRAAIASQELQGRLAPKVSVVVDAGGSLHLDDVSADVRLRVVARSQGPRFHVALAGNAREAVSIATVREQDAVETVNNVLRVVAEHGRDARASEIVRAHGPDAFRSAFAGCTLDTTPLPARPRAEPVGTHPLRDGSLALGVGLAFGHTDGAHLTQLIAAARRAGAAGVRTAARALLVVGVGPEAVPALIATAEQQGLVVRKDDPRRYIAACAGAPICSRAKLPARTIAPAIAQAAAALLDGSFTLHLSGCVKGCAHPAASLLTVIGQGDNCDLVIDGSTGAQPVGAIPTGTLAMRLAELGEEIKQQQGEVEHACDVLARLGKARVAALLAGVPHG